MLVQRHPEIAGASAEGADGFIEDIHRRMLAFFRGAENETQRGRRLTHARRANKERTAADRKPTPEQGVKFRYITGEIALWKNIKMLGRDETREDIEPALTD